MAIIIDAVKYDTLTFKEAIDQNLEVMDMTAFTMCKDFNIPIVVCDVMGKGNLSSIAIGHRIGTFVSVEKE